MVLQCAHLIPSLLFPPLFSPPPPHRPRSFFSSLVGVILTSALLTSSLDCIWPSGKRRQRRASSFSRKKPLHFSLIDESPIGRFHHLSSQVRPWWRNVCIPVKMTSGLGLLFYPWSWGARRRTVQCFVSVAGASADYLLHQPPGELLMCLIFFFVPTRALEEWVKKHAPSSLASPHRVKNVAS